MLVVNLLYEGEQARASLAGTDGHCHTFPPMWYKFTRTSVRFFNLGTRAFRPAAVSGPRPV